MMSLGAQGSGSVTSQQLCHSSEKSRGSVENVDCAINKSKSPREVVASLWINCHVHELIESSIIGFTLK